MTGEGGLVLTRDLVLTPAHSFVNPFQEKSRQQVFGETWAGKRELASVFIEVSSQEAEAVTMAMWTSWGPCQLGCCPLPRMPLESVTSHVSPGRSVWKRTTQPVRRKASVYRQGRGHLPPSAVEKLCGDKSRAECHCACVACPNPNPQTQSELGRQQAKLKLALLLGSVKDLSFSTYTKPVYWGMI